MQHGLEILGPADRGVERLEQVGQHQPEQQPEDHAQGQLHGRGREHRRVRQIGQVHDVDVALLDRLRHARLLVVLADVVAQARQRVHPAVQPHLLLGHGGEDLDGRAALAAEAGERFDTGHPSSATGC